MFTPDLQVIGAEFGVEGSRLDFPTMQNCELRTMKIDTGWGDHGLSSRTCLGNMCKWK